MSLTVLLIGALHALPPIVAVAVTNSRLAVLVVAVITGYVAISAGGSQYTLVDLTFLAIATFLSWQRVSTNSTAYSRNAVHLKKSTQTSLVPTPKINLTLEERRQALLRDAENGNCDAQGFLSHLLLDDGNIVSASFGPWSDLYFPQDIEQGFFWLNKAIDCKRGGPISFDQDFLEQTIMSGAVNLGYLERVISSFERAIEHQDSQEIQERLEGLKTMHSSMIGGMEDVALEKARVMRAAYVKKYMRVSY